MQYIYHYYHLQSQYFFNILGLRKNKENLNFTNQISLDGKDVVNLFFLRETSTIYYLSGVLSIFLFISHLVK